MESFVLDDFQSPVQVELTKDITKQQLLNFKAFDEWKKTLRMNLALQYTNPDHPFREHPYELNKIKIQSVDWFGKRIGFVKLQAYIRNAKNVELPGIAFLRGGSVAVLMILRPRDSRDERWVVMTDQPRVPAGSLSFVEIPAGMLDDAGSGDIYCKAAQEVFEETNFKLPESELIDLTELALKQSKLEGDHLQNAMYPSPGGSDECIRIILWEKVSKLFHDTEHKLTGRIRNYIAKRSRTFEVN
jgi:ADP-sugar diphosphatase